MKRYYSLLLYLVVTITAIANSAGAQAREDQVHAQTMFGTWNGLGPDKWASIWLIQRFVSPGKRVSLIPYNSRPADLQLFDIPGTQNYRTTDASTFSQLMQVYDLKSEGMKQLEDIVHDIEINLWLPDSDPNSKIVEKAFRALQQFYGRDRVPYTCYMAFFDRVIGFAAQASGFDGLSVETLAMPGSCGREAPSLKGRVDHLVPELPISELLDLMRGGMKVVFVDVREPEEFAETHIPGAINIPIRDLNTKVIEELKTADLVVSYCVKDFRAFEMARKLQKGGIESAVILRPFGLSGWIDTRLPVTRPNRVSEQEAFDQLAGCLDRNDTCQARL